MHLLILLEAHSQVLGGSKITETFPPLCLLGCYCKDYEDEKGPKASTVAWRSAHTVVIKIQTPSPSNKGLLKEVSCCS